MKGIILAGGAGTGPTAFRRDIQPGVLDTLQFPIQRIPHGVLKFFRFLQRY